MSGAAGRVGRRGLALGAHSGPRLAAPPPPPHPSPTPARPLPTNQDGGRLGHLAHVVIGLHELLDARLQGGGCGVLAPWGSLVSQAPSPQPLGPAGRAPPTVRGALFLIALPLMIPPTGCGLSLRCHPALAVRSLRPRRGQRTPSLHEPRTAGQCNRERSARPAELYGSSGAEFVSCRPCQLARAPTRWARSCLASGPIGSAAKSTKYAWWGWTTPGRRVFCIAFTWGRLCGRSPRWGATWSRCGGAAAGRGAAAGALCSSLGHTVRTQPMVGCSLEQARWCCSGEGSGGGCAVQQSWSAGCAMWRPCARPTPGKLPFLRARRSSLKT